MLDFIKSLFTNPVDTLSKNLKAQILVFGALAEIICVVLLVVLPNANQNAVLAGMLIVFIVVVVVYALVEQRAAPAPQTHPVTPLPDVATSVLPVGAGSSKPGNEAQLPKELAGPSPVLDVSEMRRAYLNWVINQTSKLNLEGVNLRDAGQEKDARISLQAIYTALLTLYSFRG